MSNPSSSRRSNQLPMASERLIDAACTLGTNEMRQRLRAWRDVRERALSIEPIRGGVRLALGPDQPMRWQRGAARDWRPQSLTGRYSNPHRGATRVGIGDPIGMK